MQKGTAITKEKVGVDCHEHARHDHPCSRARASCYVHVAYGARYTFAGPDHAVERGANSPGAKRVRRESVSVSNRARDTRMRLEAWRTAQKLAGGGGEFRLQIQQRIQARQQLLADGLQVWRESWRRSKKGPEVAIKANFQQVES